MEIILIYIYIIIVSNVFSVYDKKIGKYSVHITNFIKCILIIPTKENRVSLLFLVARIVYQIITICGCFCIWFHFIDYRSFQGLYGRFSYIIWFIALAENLYCKLKKIDCTYHIGTFYADSIKKYIIGYVCILIIQIISLFSSLDTEDMELILLLCTAFYFAILMLFLREMAEYYMCGYRLEGNSIYFYKNFKRNTKSISDIKTIIISNAFIYGRYGETYIGVRKKNKLITVPRPRLTIFFEDINVSKIQNYRKFLTSIDVKVPNYRKFLTSIDVEERIYSDKELFGFVLREEIFVQILKQYKGKVYISNSILENFQDDFDKYKEFNTDMIGIMDCYEDGMPQEEPLTEEEKNIINQYNVIVN